MKNTMNYLITFVVITLLSITFVSCDNVEEKITSDISDVVKIDEDSIVVEKQQKDTITIVAVGDMMIGTNYPSSPNYLPPNNDCSSLLSSVIEYLRDADLTFGNCEGVFSDKPEYAKHCNDPKWCYRFSMPEKYVNCFVDAGFDVVSIANNHIHDLGTYGRDNTIRVLEEAGLNFAGVLSIPTDTFTLDGVKYGFCAFAPNSGTCQITDYATMEKTVKQLRTECQIVLVSFHGGAEGSKHEHVPRTYEHFLGQNRGDVYKFAHLAIDAGADIVIGHGPHVTRGIELYNGKFIAYSLGNFCTYRRFNIQGVSGLAPIIKLWLDKDGNFLKGKITPVYQDKMTGTKFDPKGKVIKRMQELIAADFPDGVLEITDDGLILKK